MYTAIQALPLIMVVLVKNTGPLVTAVLSYLILKERLTRFDVALLLISFSGVVLLINGIDKESNSTKVYKE